MTDGSLGRAMREARLQLAFVNFTFCTRSETHLGETRFVEARKSLSELSRSMIPRLGEPCGDAHGDMASSGMRLGDTGRKECGGGSFWEP